MTVVTDRTAVAAVAAVVAVAGEADVASRPLVLQVRNLGMSLVAVDWSQIA